MEFWPKHWKMVPYLSGVFGEKCALLKNNNKRKNFWHTVGKHKVWDVLRSGEVKSCQWHNVPASCVTANCTSEGERQSATTPGQTVTLITVSFALIVCLHAPHRALYAPRVRSSENKAGLPSFATLVGPSLIGSIPVLENSKTEWRGLSECARRLAV